MSFSENLMRLRKQKGLSQEEFANEIDVSRQTVSKWELGSSTPEMEKLMQMSNFFGVSVDDLLNSDDITSKTIKVENTNNINETEKAPETNYNNYKTESDGKENKKKKTVTALIVTLIVGVIITILTILIILLIRDFDEKENNKSSKNKVNNMTSNVVENKIENNITNNVSNNVTNTIENNVTPTTFNADYHNGRIKGDVVEQDLSKLVTNNKTNKKIQISVIHGDIATSNANEINELKKSLDMNEYYEVSLEYDDEGYICTYVIEAAKKSKEETSNDAHTFNIFFNRGTWAGFHITYALERVITSNDEHPDKQIYVKYNDIETNDRNEIKGIKTKLGTHTEYDVEFEYDDEGYINKYIIEDK